MMIFYVSEQHLSVARYLFYMRCMVQYIKFLKIIFRATPKRRKVFVLHALHGTLRTFYNVFLRATPKRRKVFVLHALHGISHKLNNDLLFIEQHLSVARYWFYMRCMVHYVNLLLFLSNT
jgi:hypothetical protein